MTYDKWRRRLANANDPAFLPIAYIDELLMGGLAQFWASPEASMITEIVHWPGGAKSCRIIAAAGKKAEIIGPLGNTVEQWAREQGCSHAFVPGREGWRKLRPDYRHYQTIIVKDL